MWFIIHKRCRRCAEQFILVGIFGQTEAISCHRFWPDVWPDKYLATAPAVNYVGIPNPLLQWRHAVGAVDPPGRDRAEARAPDPLLACRR